MLFQFEVLASCFSVLGIVLLTYVLINILSGIMFILFLVALKVMDHPFDLSEYYCAEFANSTCLDWSGLFWILLRCFYNFSALCMKYMIKAFLFTEIPQAMWLWYEIVSSPLLRNYCHSENFKLKEGDEGPLSRGSVDHQCRQRFMLACSAMAWAGLTKGAQISALLLLLTGFFLLPAGCSAVSGSPSAPHHFVIRQGQQLTYYSDSYHEGKWSLS